MEVMETTGSSSPWPTGNSGTSHRRRFLVRQGRGVAGEKPAEERRARALLAEATALLEVNEKKD